MEKMGAIMTSLREHAPEEIAGMKVIETADYKKSERVDIISGKVSKIDLPKSNVLAYKLPDGNSVIVRPSGTEPKLKAYITACGKDEITPRLSAKSSANQLKNSRRKITPKRKDDKNAEERNMDKSGRHSSGGSDGDKRRCGGNNRFCRRNGSRNGSEHLEH